MDRAEHLAWAKQRALEYLDRGDIRNAFTSMASDLSKHPELRAIGDKMGDFGILCLINKDAEGLRRWINGFQ